MPLGEGDFVLVEYTLKVKETGEVIDTTSEDEAKKTGTYDARERYGPRLVIVGEHRLIEGLEEAIASLDEGKETEIEIPPEKAFGKRSPENIKIIPRSQFIRAGIAPQPGKVVEINGKLAIIRSVSGGRVIVDFNHPLAGKVIVAHVRVVKVLKSPEEKLLHLFLRRLPPFIKEDDVKVEYDVEKRHARYVLNEKALLVQDMQTAKRIVVAEIQKYMPNEVRSLEFVEKVGLAKSSEEAKQESNTEVKESEKTEAVKEGS